MRSSLQIDDVRISDANIDIAVAHVGGRLDIEGTFIASKEGETIEILKDKEGSIIEVEGQDDRGTDISGVYDFESFDFEEEDDIIKYSATLQRK